MSIVVRNVFYFIKLIFIVIGVAHIIACIWCYIGISETNLGISGTWFDYIGNILLLLSYLYFFYLNKLFYVIIFYINFNVNIKINYLNNNIDNIIKINQKGISNVPW